MKYRWISWYHYCSDSDDLGEFCLYFPWWESGRSLNLDHPFTTICAVIPFESAIIAESIIINSYDKIPDKLDWRFNELREGSPFCERFPKAEWIWWPNDS